MTDATPDIPRHGPLTTARLGLHTVSRLQPRQLAGVLERKARHAVLPRLPVDFDDRYERRTPETLRVSFAGVADNSDLLRDCLEPRTRASAGSRLAEFSEGRLAFLGEEVRLASDLTIGWDDDQLTDVPLLWWLKYQSLEVLSWFVFGDEGPARDPAVVSDTLDPWLRAFISTTRIGSPGYLRRDWIPHAVSLRIMHLCRYCAWLAAHDMLASRGYLLTFLYKNALFLRNHVEHDVGGNHLVENAVALLMAGLVFDDNRDWLQTGLTVLGEAAETQFLSDGGHFERSPMYHVMVLTRYLTAVDLLDRYGRSVPSVVRRTTRDATAFLRTLSPPDERIPLLNDAVFDEMLALTEVLRYADAQSISPSGHRELAATGYYWLGTGDDRMLVDGGALGPPHLPGHSHVDLLSIMLWLDGQRVLTDTGVYQYTADDRRIYARSARAHNTVQVGASGPIEVGGQYLMGARVEPEVVSYDPDEGRFVGQYRCPGRSSNPVRHTRAISAEPGRWTVSDTIAGDADERISSRLHFHPDTRVDPDGSGAFRISRQSGDTLGTVRIDDDVPTELRRTPYFPRFGVVHERDALEMTYSRGENTFTVSAAAGPNGQS